MSDAVWIIAECDGNAVSRVTYELLWRGRLLADKLGGPLAAVVLGCGVSDEDLEDLQLRGADQVYAADHPALKTFIVENRSSVLVRLIRQECPAIIIAAATTSGRTLMPHAAVCLGTGLTADCTELDVEAGTGALLQTRPAIGGNIMATIRTPLARPQMATVRPHSSPEAERVPGRRGVIHRVAVEDTDVDARIRWLGVSKRSDDGPGVQDAEVIVACGRGFKKKENLKLAESLAHELGAAVGASREAVDRGWASYPQQIGLSGKTVSPELYIAVGISGAVQHLAGIKTAKTIVAINSDADAPILKVADFGIVGDLFEILPRLSAALRGRKNTA